MKFMKLKPLELHKEPVISTGHEFWEKLCFWKVGPNLSAKFICKIGLKIYLQTNLGEKIFISRNVRTISALIGQREAKREPEKSQKGAREARKWGPTLASFECAHLHLAVEFWARIRRRK